MLINHPSPMGWTPHFGVGKTINIWIKVCYYRGLELEQITTLMNSSFRLRKRLLLKLKECLFQLHNALERHLKRSNLAYFLIPQTGSQILLPYSQFYRIRIVRGLNSLTDSTHFPFVNFIRILEGLEQCASCRSNILKLAL